MSETLHEKYKRLLAEKWKKMAASFERLREEHERALWMTPSEEDIRLARESGKPERKP